MPLPFDAVGAATWLVGAVAERLVGDGVAAWAARHGLDGAEVPRLSAALRRANLVLGAARAGGKNIGNEELAGPIAAVRCLAADARATSSTSSTTSRSTTRYTRPLTRLLPLRFVKSRNTHSRFLLKLVVDQ
ncbi:hypothetical protein ACQ4PT_000957 [Festuca glaucescens]